MRLLKKSDFLKGGALQKLFFFSKNDIKILKKVRLFLKIQSRNLGKVEPFQRRNFSKNK